MPGQKQTQKLELEPQQQLQQRQQLESQIQVLQPKQQQQLRKATAAVDRAQSSLEVAQNTLRLQKIALPYKQNTLQSLRNEQAAARQQVAVAAAAAQQELPFLQPNIQNSEKRIQQNKTSVANAQIAEAETDLLLLQRNIQNSEERIQQKEASLANAQQELTQLYLQILEAQQLAATAAARRRAAELANQQQLATPIAASPAAEAQRQSGNDVEQPQQNRRKPYYALSKVSGRVFIEGNLDRDGEHEWNSLTRNDRKSLGELVKVVDLEKWYGKNWRSQFEELKDLMEDDRTEWTFKHGGIDQPTEYIIPKPMLMETWSSALKKDNRDAKIDAGPNSDTAFARRMQEDDGLKPMSDAGWLDKKSIRRTIDKTLHSNVDTNLARLAKYRLKKERAVGNYVFGKWKRDRYQRKEAALTKILEANYILQEGEILDILTNRENTLQKLSAAIRFDVQTLNSRQVKRLKLK